MQEKDCAEKQVFNANETDLFYKHVGKWTYTTEMAFKAPGFKSFKDHTTLLLCASAKSDFKLKLLMAYRAPNPQKLKWKKLEQYAIGDWTKKCGWHQKYSRTGSTTTSVQ